MKKDSMILVVVLVGGLLLAPMPTWSGEIADVTNASVDGGRIEINTITDEACYRETVESECIPMVDAQKLEFCDGVPSEDNCRTFTYSTRCFAYNLYIYINGKKVKIP